MADNPIQDRKIGLSHTRVGGRFVTAYEPELALLICERIAEGDTLKKICEEDGMPARQTFHRWVVNQPDLSRAYAAAREISANAFEEEALEISRTLSAAGQDFTSTKVRAYDVAMNQFRWSAARRNPKTYSERGSVQVTVPIQINTSLDLGDGGMIAAEHPDIYTLTAHVADVPPEPVEAIQEMQREDAGPLVPMSKGRSSANKTKWMKKKVRERMDRLAREDGYDC